MYNILIIGRPESGKTQLALTLKNVLESLGKTCSLGDSSDSLEYNIFESVNAYRSKQFNYVIYIDTSNQDNEMYFTAPKKYNYYINNYQFDINASSIVKHIWHLRQDEF